VNLFGGQEQSYRKQGDLAREIKVVTLEDSK